MHLTVDDDLIEKACRRGNHKTKSAAVTAAVEEDVRHHRQLRILDAFGTIDFDPAYDYKAERNRRTAKR